jgi:prepilin-type processing-associated H-X9-DG protein
LAYIVNCGQRDDADESEEGASTPYAPGDGVFHNHIISSNNSRARKVGLDYITSHDGPTTTLMLSETVIPPNLDYAVQWVYDYGSTYSAGNDPASEDPSPIVPEQRYGFIWDLNNTNYRINYDIDHEQPSAPSFYPRPASRHGGGVVVSFADGHQQFLNETIDYALQIRLMTPAGDEVVDEGQL